MDTIHDALDAMIARYAALAGCRDAVLAAFTLLRDSFASGGRLYLAGNGGSAADAEHISGELLKGFLSTRRARGEDYDALAAVDPSLAEKLQCGLPAIPLTGFISARSAFANDVDASLEYAQLIWSLGRPGDVLWGISTSGNAANVLQAAKAARARGMKLLAMTARDGGALAGLADVALRVPEDRTHLAQELHLPIYHALCIMLERHFYAE